jgi:hypothetical protein
MKRNPVFIGTVVAIALCACASGCGYDKVQFKVTQDGEPVSGATVILVPADSSATLSASGFTNAEGICSISTLGKSGAPRGSYKVLVTKVEARAGGGPDQDPRKLMEDQMPKDGPHKPKQTDKGKLPAKYAEAATTPFSVTVPTSGTVILTLEADKKGDTP